MASTTAFVVFELISAMTVFRLLLSVALQKAVTALIGTSTVVVRGIVVR